MQASKQSGPHDAATLRTAVIAALVEQPGYGAEVTGRLNMRMGSTWKVSPKRVYEALEKLEKEGLATSVVERAPEVRSGWRRMYRPTALAERARAEWMAGSQAVLLVRADIYLRIAFAGPEDAPLVLAALDRYEQDCMAIQEQSPEMEVRPRSWRGMVVNLTREAVREQLHAQLRWIKRAREEIEEWLAEPR